MKNFNFKHLPNWVALASLIPLVITNMGFHFLPPNFGNIMTLFFALIVGLGIFNEPKNSDKK